MPKLPGATSVKPTTKEQEEAGQEALDMGASADDTPDGVDAGAGSKPEGAVGEALAKAAAKPKKAAAPKTKREPTADRG